MADNHTVVRKIQGLTIPSVRDWLEERLRNCYRHAQSKTGKDKDGWLEDAAYFAAAIGIIEEAHPMTTHTQKER